MMFFGISGTFVIPFYIVIIYFIYAITTWSTIQTNIRFPPRTTNCSRIMFHQILIEYDIKIVMSMSCDKMCFVASGAGAAGLAIIRLLIAMGLDPHHVILCDRHGAIYEGRDDLNPQKEEMAKITNSGHKAGTLAEMLVDADVFIGVSAPHCVTPEMVKSMAKDPIIFAMANPTPEIMPDEALAAGAAVMGTGRSDFPNQINNVLAFPGIFRGALDVRASDINDAMKIAAAKAIADFVTPEKLSAEYIIPSPLEEGVSAAVAKAVAQAAKDTGVARV